MTKVAYLDCFADVRDTDCFNDIICNSAILIADNLARIFTTNEQQISGELGLKVKELQEQLIEKNPKMGDSGFSEPLDVQVLHFDGIKDAIECLLETLVIHDVKLVKGWHLSWTAEQFLKIQEKHGLFEVSKPPAVLSGLPVINKTRRTAIGTLPAHPAEYKISWNLPIEVEFECGMNKYHELRQMASLARPETYRQDATLKREAGVDTSCLESLSTGTGLEWHRRLCEDWTTFVGYNVIDLMLSRFLIEDVKYIVFK